LNRLELKTGESRERDPREKLKTHSGDTRERLKKEIQERDSRKRVE